MSNLVKIKLTPFLGNHKEGNKITYQLWAIITIFHNGGITIKIRKRN